MKRIFAAFAAVLLIFSFSACGGNQIPEETTAVPTTAENPLIGETNDYEYIEFSDHIELTKVKHRSSHVTLPANINGKPVTSFGKIFYGSITLVSVTIPGSYTAIDDQAFYNCVKLSSVNITSPSLTSIGDRAFFGCQELKAATIPSNVTEIHEDAFKYCTGLIVYGSSGSAAEEFCSLYSSIYFRSVDSEKEETTESVTAVDASEPVSEDVTEPSEESSITEIESTQEETTTKKAPSTTKKKTTKAQEQTTAAPITTAAPDPLDFLDGLLGR